MWFGAVLGGWDLYDSGDLSGSGGLDWFVSVVLRVSLFLVWVGLVYDVYFRAWGIAMLVCFI